MDIFFIEHDDQYNVTFVPLWSRCQNEDERFD